MAYKLDTVCIHGSGQRKEIDNTGSISFPIYQTAAYVFDSSAHSADRFALRDPGNIYGRLTNPTQEVFENRMAALEGGTGAIALASGAAAVTYALENVLAPGDHIIAADNLYGGSYNLIVNNLSARGIEYTIVDFNDSDAIERAFRPNTKVVYGETFGSPNSDVTNIERVAEIAHAHDTIFIIDNTFGTPYLIRPLEH